MIIALSILAPPAASARQSGAIVAGQMIRSQSTSPIGGWRVFSGGMYPARTTANSVTTEVHACCFLVLKRGDAYTIARTEAVEKTARGGVVTERVLDTKVVTRAPYEEISECGPLWIEPVLSFRDKRSRSVRSIVMTNDDYTVISWTDLGNTCQFQD
ncbi:hypothetical protein [Caulobacter sp. LARHSG274]